jgi:hypothetical protein
MMEGIPKCCRRSQFALECEKEELRKEYFMGGRDIVRL